MFDPNLAGLLCCPLSGQSLRLATQEELRPYGSHIEEGLLRADGLVLYPIRNGIPLLVASEAIRVESSPIQVE